MMNKNDVNIETKIKVQGTRTNLGLLAGEAMGEEERRRRWSFLEGKQLVREKI